VILLDISIIVVDFWSLINYIRSSKITLSFEIICLYIVSLNCILKDGNKQIRYE